MKRLVCCISLAIILTPVMSFSQLSAHYGVKLGAVAASQSWEYRDLISTESRWGFDLGGFAEPFQWGPFSVLGEIHYVQKGAKITGNFTVRAMNYQGYVDTVLTIKPRLDYLTFAIYGKVLVDASFLRAYGLAGPRIDFVIGKEDDGWYDDFKGTDVGATFGIGLDIPVSMMLSVLVEIRYSPSFTEGLKTPSVTVKNKSVELLLGVQL